MSYYKTKTIMNKKMFARSHRAAEVIYNALAVKSNCFVKANKPVRADFVIAIDDDPTSALWASWMYHKIRAEYGYRPAVLCVGGKGLLSRHTHDKSEAELLRDVCIRLGVSPQSIGLAPLGTNTGANVQAVKKIIPAGQTAIWCITKRQSLRTERTVAQQAPEIISRYFVIEEKLDEAAKLMNGKGLAQMEMMFHEIAGTLERCERYAGTFQKPIDGLIEITPEIREADAFLRRHYRLKLMNKTVRFCGREFSVPVKNLKSVCQLANLLREVKKNRCRMKDALTWEIRNMADLLLRQKLVTSEERETMDA